MIGFNTTKQPSRTKNNGFISLLTRISLCILLFIPAHMAFAQKWNPDWLLNSPYVCRGEINVLWVRANHCFKSSIQVDLKEEGAIDLSKYIVHRLISELKVASEGCFKQYFKNSDVRFTQEQLRFVRDRVAIKWLLAMYDEGVFARPNFYGGGGKVSFSIPPTRECFDKIKADDQFSENCKFFFGYLNELYVFGTSNYFIDFKYNMVLRKTLSELDDSEGRNLINKSMPFYKSNHNRDLSDYTDAYRADIFDSDVSAAYSSDKSNYTGD